MFYLLTALGGSALLLLYFKVRSVFNIWDAETIRFRTGPFVALLVIGAIVALIARWLFSRAVPLLVAGAAPRKLRVVWAGAMFPLLLLPLIVLPLDLVIAGTGAFTRDWSGSAAIAWAGASTALSMGLLLWSLVLFVLGLMTTYRWSLVRAEIFSLLSLVFFVVTGAAVIGAILGLERLFNELGI